MSTTPTKYFAVPQGKVYIAERNASGQTSGFVHVGDCDESTISVDQSFLDIQESMSGLQSLVAHLLTKTDVSTNLSLLSFDGDNLARAFYGTDAAQAAGTVTGEAITGYNGQMSVLKYPGVSSVVVKKGGTTLVAGTDYTLEADSGSITFLTGSTQVPAGAGTALTVDYSHGGYASKVRSFSADTKDYTIRVVVKSKFDNQLTIITIHRVNLNAAATISLIGTGVNKLQLNGKVLAAPELVGSADYSEYFTIVQK